MFRVLDATDAESSVFVPSSGIWGFLLVSNGGAWVIQALDPDGTWHTLPCGPSGSGYDATGAFIYQGFEGLPMKFTGGTIGAKIWVDGVPRP